MTHWERQLHFSLPGRTGKKIRLDETPSTGEHAGTGSAEFANAPKDRTHFNEQGARAMAALVMPELLRLEPRLKPLLVPAK
ncbi:MAG: hypothetical protein WCO56_13535 [Verrucomicrobiota bacterium]